MHTQLFCSSCGVERANLKDFLCETCYFSDKNLTAPILDKINVNLCTLCGLLQRGAMSEKTDRISIELFVKYIWNWMKEEFTTPIFNPITYESDLHITFFNHKTPTFTLSSTWEYKPIEEFSEMKQEVEQEIQILKEPCKDCRARDIKNSKAKVQIRRYGGGKLTKMEHEEIEEIIRNYDESLLNPYEDEAGLRENEGGLDIDLFSRNMAITMARTIKAKMIAQMGEFRELIGEDRDGIPNWKYTISLKLAAIPVGTIFAETEKDIFYALDRGQKKVKVRNLKSGVIKWINPFEKSSRRRKLDDHVTWHTFLLLSIRNGVCELLDMQSGEYREVNEEQVPAGYEEGQEVRGFSLDDEYFIV